MNSSVQAIWADFKAQEEFASENSTEGLGESDPTNICLIVANSRFYVGQSILTRKSSVFRVLFEKNLDCSDVVLDDPNIEVEGFGMFLNYLYSGSIYLTNENFFPIFYLAKTFKIDPLANRCRHLLTYFLSETNLFNLWTLLRYDEPACAKCLAFFFDRSATILPTLDFRRVDRSQVLQIISSGDASCVDELRKFLRKWLRANPTEATGELSAQLNIYLMTKYLKDRHTLLDELEYQASFSPEVFKMPFYQPQF